MVAISAVDRKTTIWFAAFSLTVILIASAVIYADEESSKRYRISYRRNVGVPWTFYADVKERDRAERFLGRLKQIGFEGQIDVVTAGAPLVSMVPRTPEAPPRRQAPQQMQPQRTARSSRSNNNFFPEPRLVQGPQRPGHKSFDVLNNNGWNLGRNGFLGVGGIGLNYNNPMAGPQLGGMYGRQRGASGHPTSFP